MAFIGIDLGGTKIEIAVIEDSPQNLLFKKRIPTEKKAGYGAVLSKIKTLYDEAVLHCPDESFLGIAVPGSPSPATQKIRNANLTELNGKNLQQDLEQLLKIPVNIANDANCFALSEAIFGAGKGFDRVLGLILGSGVGAGIVINQQLVVGKNGIAGEIGHSMIDMFGKPCWCGNRGCIERYVSGSALQQLDAAFTGKQRTGEQIWAAYHQHEKQAVCVLEEYLNYFSHAIANVVSALDPDVIVLGGGLSNVAALYHDGFNAMKSKLLVRDYYPTIVRNSLGDSSGVFGAALLPRLSQAFT